MTTVLLISANFGDGHRQVANALRESFAKRGVTVHELDCFQQTNRFAAEFSKWAYESSTRYVPSLYGMIHRVTARLNTNSVIWKLSKVLSQNALMKGVQQFRPDIVLQLFPDHAAEALLRFKDKPYVGVVITDFSVHSRWFHKGVDAYFVPHIRLTPEMRRFTLRQADMVDFGIPIREHFRHLSELHADQQARKPYVVIATGGRGVFPQLDKVIASILHGRPGRDVHVLCGRNVDMLNRVESMSTVRPEIHGLPYIDNLPTWYRNAEFAVVKAGGVTVSECLACHCPMLFFKPQPGQEADNALFLDQFGAGLLVRNHRHLEHILCDKEFDRQLSAMKCETEKLSRPRAAEDIADYVLRKAGCR